MGWIERAVDRTLEQRAEKADRLADEVAELKSNIKSLQRERASMKEELDLSAEVVRLKRKLTELEITKSKADEDNARKIRDTEHRVGLLKIQQEHEVANAKRETELQVREGNLAAERDRFSKEMDFQREQLEAQLADGRDLLRQVLDRLPDINVALQGGLGVIRQKKAADGS